MPCGVRKIVMLVALCGASASLFAGIRQNDFTRANDTFKREYKRPELNSNLSDARYYRNDERVEKKEFISPEDAKRLQNSRYISPDDTEAKDMQNAVFEKSGNKADVPELKHLKNEWENDKTPNFKNKDQKIESEYTSNIDPKRENKYNNKMRQIYDELQELSMQDMNKYNFRSSHSSDAGIKTSIAGSQLHDEDTSFIEDLIYGKTDVGRESVGFRKNTSIGLKPERSGGKENVDGGVDFRRNLSSGAGYSRAGVPSAPSSTPPNMNGPMRRDQIGDPNEKIHNTESTEIMGFKKETVMEKELKGSLFQPKQGGKAGKLTIKVEMGGPRTQELIKINSNAEDPDDSAPPPRETPRSSGGRRSLF